MHSLQRATDEAKQERVPIPTWGPSTATDYGLAALNRRGPDEISHLLTSHLVLCTFTPCSGRETRLAGSRIRTATALPGSCEVVPAGSDYWARWHHKKEVALFSLDSAWFGGLALQELDRSKVELETDALPFASARIKQFAAMLRSEFRQSHGQPSRLYTDSLLTLLALELLKNHFSGSAKREKRTLRMPRRAMDAVLECMRSEIGTPIRLQRLACVAGYSMSHFLKSFKAETGQTPHHYLLGLRLDLAEELLVTTNLTIAEIALKAGFSGQAHLTSTLTTQRLVSPGVLRRHAMRARHR